METPSRTPEARPRSRGISFVAPDIAQAITDIRERLGSEAIVLDIRRVPARGIGRLWQRPRIEVIACPPDAAPDGASPSSSPSSSPGPGAAPSPAPAPGTDPNVPAPVAVPRQEAVHRYARAGGPAGGSVPSDPASPDLGSALGRDVFEPSNAPRSVGTGAPVAAAAGSGAGAGSGPAGWRCRSVFERLDLIPLAVERVVSEMQSLHGAGRVPPETMAQELVVARAALRKLWRPTPIPASDPPGAAPLHVFLGAPGCGKSTALCKWLAQSVLIDGKTARVWRLDGRTTNPSELVSLYGEILGVPVERTWNGRTDPDVTGFVDLGGADFRDQESLDALAGTVARLSGATIHLVLNAAYTVPLLLAQVRAFSGLLVDDLIVTHLDEEPAWGKLWNLVLGTNFPISRLGAGQNIPGHFSLAQPEMLTPSLFGL